jgi:hypothetical protein
MSYSLPATVALLVSPPANSIPGDLDYDGIVGLADLAQLLSVYGTETNGTPHPADLDGDGRIGVRDAVALRNAFTPLPPPGAVVARASDRAIVQLPDDLDVLRAGRRNRRPIGSVPQIDSAVTDRLFAMRGQEHGNDGAWFTVPNRSRQLTRTAADPRS